MSNIINPYRFSSGAPASSATMPSEIDYLVVGGGGGAGSPYYGGGGGAGGYNYVTAESVSEEGEYIITVGTGGAGGSYASYADRGDNGLESKIVDPMEMDISQCDGGGGGGGYIHTAQAEREGRDGGSGGGAVPGGDAAGVVLKYGGSASGYGDGNEGGDGGVYGTWSYICAAGGGGAGSAGADGYISTNTTTQGNIGTGGDATSNSITGSAVAYAGGGGGGLYYSQNASSDPDGGSAGGVQSGGDGGRYSTSSTTRAEDGVANTGGGGGGNASLSGWDGQAGGSGIVIIKYAKVQDSVTLSAPTVSGTPTDLSTSSYYIYKWTGSGSITWSST